MRIQTSFGQSQQQRIDPKLILTNTILQYTTLELQQAIEQEIAENPALEIPDEDPCNKCEHPKSFCIDCPIRKNIEFSTNETDLSIYEFESNVDFSVDVDEEEQDFISNVSAQITLQDYLQTQLHSCLPEDQWQIGEYIISNINDSGYLECLVEEFALELNVDVTIVDSVLSVIQTFDPPGVGARNIRECVCIQLKRLKEDNIGNDIAMEVALNHWDDMVSGKIGKIARKIHVNADFVYEAIDFIQKKLNPYPGSCFRPPYQNDKAETGSSIRPDILVSKSPSGYEIDIAGHDKHVLKMNPEYLLMYKTIKNGKSNYSNEEKKHIVDAVERAELLIKSINERRRTLRQITKSVLEYHQGYIETGLKSFIRPLTRTKIAKMLGIHESTVSRATANKYIQLPSEEVVNFDFFFDGSVSIKEMIIELINSEDKQNPLSDQQIADILTERGLKVARRTVVKYREAEKILSSFQRKK